MRYLIVLFSLITFFGYSQVNDVNDLFFKIPLNESRKSIYNYCSDSGFFTKHETKGKLTKKVKEIEIYGGHLNKLSLDLIKRKIDSVEIQLSSGNVSIEGEKESKELLIFWTYYYTSDVKSAKKNYKKLKKQISKICMEKPYHFKNLGIEENEDFEKEIGYSDQWYFNNAANSEIELKYKILKENKKYLIQLGYTRYE